MPKSEQKYKHNTTQHNTILTRYKHPFYNRLIFINTCEGVSWLYLTPKNNVHMTAIVQSPWTDVLSYQCFGQVHKKTSTVMHVFRVEENPWGKHSNSTQTPQLPLVEFKAVCSCYETTIQLRRFCCKALAYVSDRVCKVM